MTEPFLIPLVKWDEVESISLAPAGVEISFYELMIEEPGLAQLANDIKKVDGTGQNFCANFVWYKQFKPRLIKLVGDFATNPVLHTRKAYDEAYQTLYKMLPDCKDCFCFRM